jgi:hypothetical protein
MEDDLGVRMMTTALDATEKALAGNNQHSIRVPSFEWFDVVHGAYGRNLERMLSGLTLDIGDNETSVPEETVTIDKVSQIVVGIDSTGIFCSVGVRDTDGREWSLYNDGSVADSDDRIVGRHSFKTMPEVTA